MSSIIKVNTVQDTDGNNIINENANTITIGASGDTITIPSGATLANNGTATGFASIAWQAVKTGDFTAVAGEGYFVNTTSGAVAATLPGSATIGDQIAFIDYAATFDTNNLTVNRNSHKIQGDASNLTVATERAGFMLVYVDATQGWLLTENN